VGAEVNARAANGATPLGLASNEGHLEAVRELLVIGADMELRDVDGETPLFAASCEGHLPVVQELLLRGAAVDVRDLDGFTPLILTSQEGHHEVVAALLKGGADVNAHVQPPAAGAAAGGSTALHLASYQGHLYIVRLLDAQGADINAVDADRRTALMYASGCSQVSVVKELLKLGADPALVNARGMTAKQLVQAFADDLKEEIEDLFP
jgi:serine/threonine-protein phosphatase 6 regulatory ankyrin repeat subunit B